MMIIITDYITYRYVSRTYVYLKPQFFVILIGAINDLDEQLVNML
jgi:hypothetical protein